MEHAADELALLDDHTRIADGQLILLLVGVPVGQPVQVDLGQAHGRDLLPCPERPRLEDGRHLVRVRVGLGLGLGSGSGLGSGLG